MYDYIYQESLKRAKHKIWIFSDLQQSEPDNAQKCLDVCMEDFGHMDKPADMIWFLGDCVEGTDITKLNKMCTSLEEAFEKVNIPVCFVAGNHDLDYERYGEGGKEGVFVPFYETVKKHQNWHFAKSFDEPYFKVPVGNFKVYFFTDHIAPDKAWSTTHGDIHGDKTKYPHIEKLKKVKDEMAKENCPVITASHYSFIGGSRPSELFNNLLPLPENVKIHFYGHAHFGDFAWAGDSPYQRISWVKMHDIPQLNVSSFENIRGRKCRSVFLHIYEDNSLGVFFRNHDDKCFSECYFPAKTTEVHKPMDK